MLRIVTISDSQSLFNSLGVTLVKCPDHRLNPSRPRDTKVTTSLRAETTCSLGRLVELSAVLARFWFHAFSIAFARQKSNSSSEN
jgi:hypothetical protein